MSNAVIVATGRTPIGRAGKGSLADVRADATAVNEAVTRLLDERAQTLLDPPLSMRETGPSYETGGRRCAQGRAAST